jgi:hypothetical protein
MALLAKVSVAPLSTRNWALAVRVGASRMVLCPASTRKIPPSDAL